VKYLLTCFHCDHSFAGAVYPQATSAQPPTQTSLPSTTNEARDVLVNFDVASYKETRADAVPLYAVITIN